MLFMKNKTNRLLLALSAPHQTVFCKANNCSPGLVDNSSHKCICLHTVTTQISHKPSHTNVTT